ncbi:hypothetical protein HIM_05663 [Hirsutella minnesotensis 3608]|uniref:Adhesin domain-containing protein n=1 Tax=Hirsutella minnesotensis 3608 TaxID=1043627 RepID=A0A0F8A001_9HYPO|nr:hypothetical protein HIM_05663 [Hirsutella minnesotensis 3608]
MEGPQSVRKPSIWQCGKRKRWCIVAVIGLIVFLALLFALLGVFVFTRLATSGQHGASAQGNWNLHHFPRKTLPISLGSDSRLSIIQKARDKTVGSVDIDGVVTVQTSASGTPATVDLDVSSTDKDLNVDLEFDETRREVKIITPPGLDFAKPRLRIRATVRVPGESCLELLNINTIQLSVDIQEGLLTCATPKATTTLDVRSISGELKIKEPLDRLAKADSTEKTSLRDYIVKMETTSGDINVDLIMIGSKAQFNSTSGNFVLRLLPVLNSTYLESNGLHPALKTGTTSGRTDIALLDPVWIGTKSNTRALSNLDSSHSSTSGNIKLRYPSSWEGKLSSSSTSGSHTIRGKGLNFNHNHEKSAEGQKGHGSLTLRIETLSGNQDVLVGDE